MENKVFSRLNLYDQIGYLMVGSVAALVAVFDAKLFCGFQLPDLNINNFIIWFVVVYFLGHLIQALANLINKIPLLNFLVKENKEEFSDEQKETLEEAKEFFKLKSKNNSYVWNVCYLYTLSKDATGQIQAFNAYYSMYRGWLITFLLQSIFLLYILIKEFSISNLGLFSISTVIALILYMRSKRFWKYLTTKVLQIYILVKNY